MCKSVKLSPNGQNLVKMDHSAVEIVVCSSKTGSKWQTFTTSSFAQLHSTVEMACGHFKNINGTTSVSSSPFFVKVSSFIQVKSWLCCLMKTNCFRRYPKMSVSAAPGMLAAKRDAFDLGSAIDKC